MDDLQKMALAKKTGLSPFEVSVLVRAIKDMGYRIVPEDCQCFTPNGEEMPVPEPKPYDLSRDPDNRVPDFDHE